MQPPHDLAEEIQHDPDSIWSDLPKDVKLKVLGYLSPEDWAQFAQVSSQSDGLADEAERTWAKYHVTNLDAQIAQLRQLQAGDLSDANVRAAVQAAFQDLMSTFAQIGQDAGLDPDEWDRWATHANYSELYQRYQDVRQNIVVWYHDNFD